MNNLKRWRLEKLQCNPSPIETAYVCLSCRESFPRLIWNDTRKYDNICYRCKLNPVKKYGQEKS